MLALTVQRPFPWKSSATHGRLYEPKERMRITPTRRDVGIGRVVTDHSLLALSSRGGRHHSGRCLTKYLHGKIPALLAEESKHGERMWAGPSLPPGLFTPFSLRHFLSSSALQPLALKSSISQETPFVQSSGKKLPL